MNQVKKERSNLLNAVAIFLMGFPATYLILAGTIFNLNLKSVVSILLSPLYYFIAAVGVITGYGFWQMQRWSWYVFAFFQTLLLYGNAYVITIFSVSQHKFLMFLGVTFVQVFIFFRITKELRVPYFLPKIHWWESSSAYQTSVPTTIKKKDEKEFEGKILDLSIVGCFVKTTHEFQIDEPVKMSFDVFGQKLKCEGKIFIKTDSSVTCPKGIGVKFNKLSRKQRSRIRVAEQRLKRIENLYKNGVDHPDSMAILKKIEELR